MSNQHKQTPGTELGLRVVEHTITLESQVVTGSLQPSPRSLEARWLELDPHQTFGLGSDRSAPVGAWPEWVFRRLIVEPRESVDWPAAVGLWLAVAGVPNPHLFEIWLSGGRAELFIGGAVNDIEVLARIWEQYAKCTAIPSGDPFGCITGRIALVEELVAHNYHAKITGPAVLSPLAGLFQAAVALPKGEVCGYELIAQRARAPWPRNIRAILEAQRLLGHRSPGGMTANAKALDQPFFVALVRIVASTAAAGLAVRAFLQSFTSETIPLGLRSRPQYQAILPETECESGFERRAVYAPGMIVAAEEIAQFGQIPGTMAVAGVQLALRSGFSVPERLTKRGISLGTFTNDDGSRTTVKHPIASQYNTHTAIIGVGGFGKSAFLNNVILDLFKSGYGLVVIDPHGSLVDALLGFLGDLDKGDRVVLVDWAASSGPIPAWNAFANIPPEEQSRVGHELVQTASHLLGTADFYRVELFLRNGGTGLAAIGENLASLLTLFERTPHGEALRRRVIERAADEPTRHFFRDEFSLYTEKDFAPLTNRTSALLADHRTRLALSVRESRIDVAAGMRNKLLLCKTSRTMEVAQVQAGLLIDHVKHAVFRRGGEPPPYPLTFLVVDELSRFKPSMPSFAQILDEGTKFGLRLWCAFQQTNQLTDAIAKTISGIDTICFRQNLHDAKFYTQVFEHKVSAETLAQLRTGSCVARIGNDIVRFDAPAPRLSDPAVAGRVIQESHDKYYVNPEEPVPERPRSRRLDPFGKEKRQ